MALPPDPGDGVSDLDIKQSPTSLNFLGSGTVPVQNVVLKQGIAPGTVKAMAYGGNQAITAGDVDLRIYRLERGYPYKRAGHFVPVMPQFKATTLTIQNLASQNNANRSAVQITTPTADPQLTNTSRGTPFIGYPGFNKLSPA